MSGRRPLFGLVAGLALVALALWPASRVELATDLVELLPAGSPAAEGYRQFVRRFGGLEKVFVLVSADPAGDADAADLTHAAGLLEEILAAGDEVASARAGLAAEDEEFFLRWVAPRAPLLVGDGRQAIARRLEPEAIRRRVASLRAALRAPGGSARGLLARSDPLGFSEGLLRPLAAGSLPVDVLTSTFLAPGGDAALLILTPARSEIDPEGGRALLAELAAAGEELRRRVERPVVVRAVGGPLYAAQDEVLLRRDLERTVSGSLAATGTLLVAAFGGFLMPLVILAPLLAALVWTAAWVGLGSGQITAVAIGFAAVLVGLGVDYGIHCGARFRQSLLDVGDAAGALAATLRHAGPGILTSALTTAAGFAVLGLAHFRPLRELGQLVAVGILSILGAVALLGSAGLVLLAPRLGPPGRLWHALGAAVEHLTGLARRRPKIVLALALGFSLLALGGLRDLEVDADLRNLRPADHPLFETEALLAEHFGLGLDTATVLVSGPDLATAVERAAAAETLLRRRLGAAAEISGPATFLSLGAPLERRLVELAELPFAAAADRLEEELRAAGLDPRAFARGLDALRALGRGEDPGAPPAAAWPTWLAESLSADEDGTWAAVRLRLPAGFWPQGPPPELAAELAAAVPGAAVASAVALGGELKILAAADLETLSLLALAAVAAVVAVSFRGHPRSTLLAVLPVLLGCLWSLGLWAGLGRPLDLFTLAVLPIMLGIGIDDGLHVVHGARRAPAAGIAGAVRSAGRALALTTLTTCVGFGSLLLSHVPGLRNGGLLIAAGVLACFLATVLVLPAIEALGSSRSAAG